VITAFVERKFPCDLDRRIEDIRPAYKFDSSARGSVPEAVIAFLESDDYEHAIRLAISLGGDADTLASISGAIAGAFYGVPSPIVREAEQRLPDMLQDVVSRFEANFLRKS
tara:strand:- start:17218 stop:17550 length:333 start_codon:yes stop_codon:yes gene_type:complete